MPRLPLRIGLVQFNPKIGQVQANIARAKELCANLEPHSLDLLCLPEMVFTGYVFPSATAISPHLEHPLNGPTSKFCSEISQKLGCYVIAGYPERLEASEQEVTDDTGPVGSNSATVYGPDGMWLSNYRKSNLFETDKTWAKAGTGFTALRLREPLPTTLTLAICMDLNAFPPHDWILEDGPYELAEHCTSSETKVLVLLSNWLDSEKGRTPADHASTEEDDSEEEVDEDEGGIRHSSDLRTANFWAARLRPLWIEEVPAGAQKGEETIVIVSNRIGKENGITFAGTSCIFSMVRGSGRPKVLHMMGSKEEGCHVWTV